MNARCPHTIAGVFEGHVTLPHGRVRVWVVPANDAVWVEGDTARLTRDGDTLAGTIDVQGYPYRVAAAPDGADRVGERMVACWRVGFSE